MLALGRFDPAGGNTGRMIEDNLTREEAAERSAKVSGVSYEVNLDLTGGGDTFVSDTTVRFVAPLVGLSTFIDLDVAGVREIYFNGRAVPAEAYDGSHSRLPLRGLLANNELRIVADASYQHTGVGLHRFVDPTDAKAYLHTQFEPYDAHRVFACFDQPDVKATFSLTVTAPDDWTVVSNGPVAEHDGGRWRFEPTPVISTYLVAVVAGPYHVVAATHGALEMRLYCRESLAGYLDAEEIFTVTRQGLDFFEAEFGLPYPFAKYDQLFVPEFNFGAMENPGCITFNESMVFRSRMTDASYEGRANTILHEMAHMWFGDLVTMRWWDDLWLNESFATYMATDALARATRFQDSWVRFASGTKAAAVTQDQLPSTHPISADIVDTDAVRLHFDGITYAKGASVLKQLVAWVGREAFTEGIRNYFDHHQWDNAELTDFLAHLEDTSGRDLGPWAEEWLQTSGVNTLRASFESRSAGGAGAGDGGGDGAGSYAAFSIAQEAVPGPPGATGTSAPATIRSHRVAVGLYDFDDAGAALVRRFRHELDVVGERTEVPELTGQPVPAFLLVNDDDLTYAKIRLDERSLATLAEHLSKVADPLARNLAWASTWDMVRDAELATGRFVDLVVRHAEVEGDDNTLTRLLGQASTAVDAYARPDRRAKSRALLAGAARNGLDSSEAGSDRQLIWARHLLYVIDGVDDLDWAASLLDGSVEVSGLKVDTDLRWQIVGTLASHGTADAPARIDAELENDPTDIGERRAAAARAALPDPGTKAQAWDSLMTAGLHLAMIRAKAGGFGQYSQDELLRPYVAPYFSSLRSIWEQRSREEALSLAKALFPGTLIDPATVEATEAALADAKLPGPLRRILLEGKDSLERALRARAADSA